MESPIGSGCDVLSIKTDGSRLPLVLILAAAQRETAIGERLDSIRNTELIDTLQQSMWKTRTIASKPSNSTSGIPERDDSMEAIRKEQGKWAVRTVAGDTHVCNTLSVPAGRRFPKRW